MNGGKNQEQKEKEVIEMAAEQFARLFWKQWHLEQGPRKFKLGNRKNLIDSHYQRRSK